MGNIYIWTGQCIKGTGLMISSMGMARSSGQMVLSTWGSTIMGKSIIMESLIGRMGRIMRVISTIII